MNQKIQNHHDLLVYQKAFGAAMQFFEASKSFSIFIMSSCQEYICEHYFTAHYDCQTNLR